MAASSALPTQLTSTNSGSTIEVYRAIMDDVSSKCAPEFFQEGLDETCIAMFRQKWEQKVLESRAVDTGEAPPEEYCLPQEYPPQPPPDDMLSVFSPDALLQQPGVPLAHISNSNGSAPQPVPANASVGTRTPPQAFVPASGTVISGSILQMDGKSDTEELGSDLDDPDEFPETDDIVLCLWEKVTRVKNKRKVILRDGIMHLDGKDVVFHTANGEITF